MDHQSKGQEPCSYRDGFFLHHFRRGTNYRQLTYIYIQFFSQSAQESGYSRVVNTRAHVPDGRQRTSQPCCFTDCCQNRNRFVSGKDVVVIATRQAPGASYAEMEKEYLKLADAAGLAEGTTST